jgi:hypothetical protein
VKDTVQAHYDLKVEIRQLLSMLDIPFSPIHIPGQHSYHTTSIKETNTDQHSNPSNTEDNIEQMLTHVITIHHKGVIVTEGLDRVVNHNINKPALKEKLMKDNAWTEEQVESVAWEEYYMALRDILRSHRASIAKLSHKLWHTNQQNQKYYGLPDTCILCKSIDHIYQCTHPSAATHRAKAQAKLLAQLNKSMPT